MSEEVTKKPISGSAELYSSLQIREVKFSDANLESSSYGLLRKSEIEEATKARDELRSLKQRNFLSEESFKSASEDWSNRINSLIRSRIEFIQQGVRPNFSQNFRTHLSWWSRPYNLLLADKLTLLLVCGKLNRILVLISTVVHLCEESVKIYNSDTMLREENEKLFKNLQEIGSLLRSEGFTYADAFVND